MPIFRKPLIFHAQFLLFKGIKAPNAVIKEHPFSNFCRFYWKPWCKNIPSLRKNRSSHNNGFFDNFSQISLERFKRLSKTRKNGYRTGVLINLYRYWTSSFQLNQQKKESAFTGPGVLRIIFFLISGLNGTTRKHVKTIIVLTESRRGYRFNFFYLLNII